jgi:hypothetical protein
MTTNRKGLESWLVIGSSVTSPADNKVRAHVSLDSHYVVVGFEANNSQAFLNDMHDLALDYGHAFFYLVRNTTIRSSFSFGPAGIGKLGWFNKGKVMTSKKNGSQNARPATADYGITETVRAFKIPVTKKQAEMLEEEVKKIRVAIYLGNTEYSALMNDTCAETAKEVLDDAGIETPNGSGWVKHSGKLNLPVAYAVNPYKWHKNFKSKFAEMIFKPKLEYEWIPVVGDDDPIFGVPSFAKADPVFGIAL